MSSSSSSISLVSEMSSKTHSTMSIESSLNDSSNEQSKMSVSTPELDIDIDSNRSNWSWKNDSWLEKIIKLKAFLSFN